MRPVLGRVHQQPDEKDAGQERNHRVRPAPTHQPAARRRKILRKCGAQRTRRKERIAQRGQRAGHADNQQHENRRNRAERRNQTNPAAQITGAAAEQVRGKRQRSQ